MLPPLPELRELVSNAAREVLMPLFADVIRHIKHDGSVVTEADVSMQQRLKSDLARLWPQYDFLGEEMPGHEHEQLTTDLEKGLWCVDPLDGTSNFATGIPYFAVSLALIINGRQELGLVYDPVRDECFMACRGQGARLNDM
ncbi:MAG: inositol monophosphatase, partial [Gammaproteobacteria bacterium]|nr:inositol monophosphatase [Gammaproteobacteria bacterium]